MAAGNGVLGGGQAVLREQHPHPAGPSQPGGQLAVAAKRSELEPPPSTNTSTWLGSRDLAGPARPGAP
jgi:hypothetical protein